jgi:hypothetical protein
MIDGIANTGTHTFVEKNKHFPIDIHLHVHSHSMRHTAVTPRDVAIIREGSPEMARSHWSILSIVTSTTCFEIFSNRQRHRAVQKGILWESNLTWHRDRRICQVGQSDR